MPIQPIDLQNMFLRMNQIGKEQAEHRNVIAQQQAAQDSSFVKETEHKDHSVNESEDLQDGPDKSDPDGKNTGKRDHREQMESERGNSEDDEKKKQNSLFDDPDLGHHVDISG